MALRYRFRTSLAASMQGWQGVGCALGVGVLCAWVTGMSFVSEGVGMGLGGAAKWVTGTSGIEALAGHRRGRMKNPAGTPTTRARPIFARRGLILVPGVFTAALLGRKRS